MSRFGFFFTMAERDAELVAQTRETIRVSVAVLAASRAAVHVRPLPRPDDPVDPELFLIGPKNIG